VGGERSDWEPHDGTGYGPGYVVEDTLDPAENVEDGVASRGLNGRLPLGLGHGDRLRRPRRLLEIDRHRFSLLQHLGAQLEYLGRPAGLDIRQDRADLLVGELAAESRHVALVACRRVRPREAVPGDAEGHRVRLGTRMS